MGSNCTAGCGAEFEVNFKRSSAERRPELNMHIFEFEARMKQFATPVNKGKVNMKSLMASFRGTPIFKELANP